LGEAGPIERFRISVWMPGRTASRRSSLGEDQVAVEIGRRHAVERAGIGRAVLPGDKLDLDLADGVARAARAAGVLVEPARAGEGEGALHARRREDDLLGLAHERVLLGEAQVAAGADVDDGLFGLAFDEELHAPVVLAVDR
jgi:hypothetical protein